MGNLGHIENRILSRNDARSCIISFSIFDNLIQLFCTVVYIIFVYLLFCCWCVCISICWRHVSVCVYAGIVWWNMELGTGKKNNLKVYMYFNQWCNRHLTSGTLERTENHAGEKNLSGILAGQNNSGRRKVRSVYPLPRFPCLWRLYASYHENVRKR